MPFPELKTERLALRQVTIEDNEEIFALLTDEKVNQHYGSPRVKSEEHARRYIHQITTGIKNNKVAYWGICLKDKSKLTGTVCIWNIVEEEGKAEIGYELLPHFQGKGIMQEALSKAIEFAFKNLNLKKIEAWTTRENHNSIKLLEKNNFIRDKDAESKIDWSKEPAGTVIYSLWRQVD